ncbi:MAG TPA: YceI family protein [Puia sp.]|jgi:polyisoprenoid-binding protein YceI|nr:YceI family protein [Puia sp.]
MENKKFKVVASLSNIDWKGRKVTGTHKGTIAIKEGEFSLNEGKLAAGKFVVDMTAITVQDITDPATNAQFVGHMASGDFFASAEYPEAIFEITSVKNNHIEGNLIIKSIRRTISFDADIHVADDKVRAMGKMIIDRTQFGIKFRSGNFFKDLGDTLIYNDFELNFHITAKTV